ncbi:MAG: UDP-N-acetylmuramoyl-L-alanine--D-glutamate ligase [Rugosibacter sp.]|nr:UDP-N-acetylmuramoyl-L-alanine--D-glutamate ligase [Rugosibacter sp.]
MSDLNGKRILVLGLGESGLASACWCVEAGARVRVADTRANPPYLAELQRRTTRADFLAGEFELHLLDDIDLVVVSPGLPSDLPIVRQALAQGLPVIGEIELFARALRALNLMAASPAPVLAITGTNGKTTTTALTGHVLRSMGQSVGVAGNISPAALTALANHVAQNDLPQVWVLELSSFQLETTTSLQAAAATVLNISDDHLDRYTDLVAYAAVKARIFQGGGVQVLNRQDAKVRGMALPGRRVISFGLDAPQAATDFGLRQQTGELWLAQGEQCLLPVSKLPMQGLHNVANVMAALALCVSLGYDVQQLLPAVLSFQGLPHRVEKVTEINGVTWYDDSKGTNVGATVAALTGIGGMQNRKIVLIAGGDGKGQDFSPLTSAVAQCARAVVLIGRDGPLIGSVLKELGVPLIFATDMSDAVQQANALAQKNDAVLLSPACASFDMFRDYAHRAEVFIAAVKNLVKATS